MKRDYYLSLVMTMVFFIPFAQTTLEKEQYTSRYDKKIINQLEKQFNATAKSEKQKALQMAQVKNWPIIIEKEGTYAELQRIASDGSPIYYATFNVDAARSTRTDHLNSGGSLGLNLNGQNMTAYVWDGGLARSTHQEYDGAGGNNRFSIGDGSSTLNFHAAHVTGTIIASGVQPDAKGMAPHAQAIGHDWNSDLSEATAAAGNGMLVSNHSYGFRSDLVPDYYFGAYITDSRDWDNLMFNAPYYLMVVAAGNDGNTNYNGSPLDGQSAYDKLTGHSTSKNNLVVANAQDASIDAAGNLLSVTINSSSSEGPTDDYRIKPDITGNGTGVYSTYESSDTAYNSITGTSMASPNVAGSILLLQQHANNVNGSYMRAATLKGLVLHTADDVGPTGPDAVYGWGLLNAKRAAETISTNGNESQVSELTLSSGQSYQIIVDSDGVNDLMASISWTDRAGTATTTTNSNSPVLVNDLDIRVSKSGTTYTPWRLTGVTTNGTGDNNVDPYERVEVANASGTYTITVTHKGSLTGGSQNYSLIVTGLSSTPVVCNATTPTNVTIDAFADTTATMSWDNVPGASYTLRYRPSGGSWTTMAVTGTSVNLSGLSPLTSYDVQVRSECPDNSTSSYSGSASFTTTDIQLNYCDAASTNVNDEYISRVQLNTIDNSSNAQFYSNFTNVSTDLQQGQSYTVTVTPTWTGTVYAEGYGVWIDYNKNGDFNDSGELVWSQTATTNTPVSGSFTIPSGTVQGDTRMRVVMQYNAVPSACGSFTYGEVEDYTVNLQSGVADNTPPVITLNGASTINLNVGDTYNELGATALDNVDGDITSSIVVGGDTVDTSTAGTYVVTYNVTDAAGNVAVQVTRTVIVTAIPSGCTGTVSVPYAESFENTIGDWSQSTNDDINWTVDANGTPSSGTGPSSASSGSYYIYVEASGNGTGYPNKRAIINSPCFDLSSMTAPTFDFDYHMYGSTDMGAVALEISTDNGSTWTSLWSESGNKGNQWNAVSVDLAAYTSSSLQLRFNRLTGSTWQADIAIDNISLSEPALPTCDDGIQNGDETGVDCGGSCAPCSSGSEIIHQGFFESGWDGWTDGGSDVFRYTAGTYSYEGSSSIRIRDNSGTASSMTLSNVDVSSYDTIEVDFYFYPRSMENNEDFWLRFYDGSSWSTVATYTRGTDFENNTFYNATVIIDSSNYNFATNSGFRFQCDASGNQDLIFIDQVTITGISNGSTMMNTLTAVDGGFTSTSTIDNDTLEEDFLIYPNPVKEDFLNVILHDNNDKATFVIRNMLGQVITQGILKEQKVSVAKLNSGMYFIEVNDGEETMVRRFIKQ